MISVKIISFLSVSQKMYHTQLTNDLFFFFYWLMITDGKLFMNNVLKYVH